MVQRTSNCLSKSDVLGRLHAVTVERRHDANVEVAAINRDDQLDRFIRILRHRSTDDDPDSITIGSENWFDRLGWVHSEYMRSGFLPDSIFVRGCMSTLSSRFREAAESDSKPENIKSNVFLRAKQTKYMYIDPYITYLETRIFAHVLN